MQVGFDALFFARADYQDKAKRQADRTMEFIWRGSKTLGASAQVSSRAFLSRVNMALIDRGEAACHLICI